MAQDSLSHRFSLDGQVAVVTGGAGLLGVQHAAAIAEAGGIPVLWDVDVDRVETARRRVADECGSPCDGAVVDITDPAAVTSGLAAILAGRGRCDILVNNAAIDPKVDSQGRTPTARFEAFSLERWNLELAVGLGGAFLCSQIVGSHMAESSGGVILNISSDLGIISPDQRIYRRPDVSDSEQPVKPVTYSVIKHGLVGLTKYLATYWLGRGVRANALAPAGVYVDQPAEFVSKLSSLIPLGRMAKVDEYRGAIQFLCSDASSYMNGACVVMDGGRCVW